jgi:hypothetical protein
MAFEQRRRHREALSWTARGDPGSVGPQEVDIKRRSYSRSPTTKEGSMSRSRRPFLIAVGLALLAYRLMEIIDEATER